MKPNAFLMALVAAGLGLSLSSCVDPYYAGHPGPHPAYGPSPYRPGYSVRSLPPGYRTETYNGATYYYHNNTYYSRRGAAYVVVDRPRRMDDYRGTYNRRNDDRWDNRPGRRPGNVTVIRELPRGYKVVNYNGQRYYRQGNTYYQSRSNGYVVVHSPY